jgi:peptidoglycan/xylan/chitin deacetylase (PgdA/CDA1 family)
LILTVFIILAAAGLHFVYEPTESVGNPALVVIRLDDVQDYAFKEAQLYLLNYSTQNKIPLSLAIIPGYFGQDNELIEAIKQNINSGSEITVHGWEHENMSQYTFSEQKIRLINSKQLLKDTLNVETDILVPPMFSYNDDTIRAMEETGYATISGISEFHKKEWISQKIQSIPATIELSDYSNNTWQMKDISAIIPEIESSIEEYGYAIIVTHPQEFMNGNELNLDATVNYEQLLQEIAKDSSFNTIEGLKTPVELER